MDNKVRPHRNYAAIIGWIAVGISIVISSYWAFWGIIENFHEGWHFESLWLNLGMMLTQYLSPMLIFMAVTLISLYWPRFGAGFPEFEGRTILECGTNIGGRSTPPPGETQTETQDFASLPVRFFQHGVLCGKSFPPIRNRKSEIKILTVPGPTPAPHPRPGKTI